MELKRNGSQPSARGPAEYFTGTVCYVQSEGGRIRTLRPGDVVWCPPNEKHWHGASPTTAMTHLAIQEELNGKVVEWMEKVMDEQYHQAREE
jgi:quercetin dioxygenase-like cupin family protein